MLRADVRCFQELTEEVKTEEIISGTVKAWGD
jgi:hypothetical protein